ncbi:DNA-methyltransferase [Acinetobacter geminorum]|uniref:DNA-methyltransferase n=1 Tax=Acinetobacter geminorum TaxID=2730922 RepID=UPI003AF4177F
MKTEINLMLGDCLERMNEIETGTVDMILCDLPYGTTCCSWDAVIPFKPLWEQYERVVKENGAIVLFAAQPFTSLLATSNLKLFRYEWIYEKPNATGFMNANKQPMRAHENILVFYKQQPVYNPIKTIGHQRQKSRRKEIGSECYGKTLRLNDYDSTERYPRSIQIFSSDKQKAKFHPTQKPVALCEYLIRTYTNVGETVLDNTMGSGTTGVACVNTGRSFIGIEQEQKYFEIAQERIAQATTEKDMQPDLFGEIA